MTSEHVFRDVTDIYVRLFNHRAALHGLTNNFVKEFEERRGEREIMALSRTLELVTDNRDRAFPSITEHLENHLEKLKISVDKTQSFCQEILKDAEEKKTDLLESQRARRGNEWQEFMSAQVIRSERVDKDFQKKVDLLRKHYAELEEKLKGGTVKVL